MDYKVTHKVTEKTTGKKGLYRTVTVCECESEHEAIVNAQMDAWENGYEIEKLYSCERG